MNRFNVGFPEQTNEPVHYLYPFFCVGIATFGQQPKQDWKCNPLVSDTKYKSVDVKTSELPVCSVHRQDIRASMREQAEDDTGYQVKIQNVTCQESLDTPHAGQTVSLAIKSDSQSIKTDSLHLAHGHYH